MREELGKVSDILGLVSKEDSSHQPKLFNTIQEFNLLHKDELLQRTIFITFLKSKIIKCLIKEKWEFNSFFLQEQQVITKLESNIMEE